VDSHLLVRAGSWVARQLPFVVSRPNPTLALGCTWIIGVSDTACTLSVYGRRLYTSDSAEIFSDVILTTAIKTIQNCLYIGDGEFELEHLLAVWPNLLREPVKIYHLKAENMLC
jgi:hypothetical protein